jgi:hypothetical protein
MALPMGELLHINKALPLSLQKFPSTQTLHLDLVMGLQMQQQAQGLCLASVDGPIKHKKSTQKKKNQSTRQQLRLCSMLRQPRRNSPPPLLCMPLQLRMLATFTNQVGHTPELLRNGLSKNKHHSPVHGIHNYCGMPHMVAPAVFSKNTSTENALPQHGITS